MFYTLLIILLNKGKEILAKKNDIEEGLEHP